MAVKPAFLLDFDRLAVEIAVCDIRNILVTTGIGTSVERPFQRTTSRHGMLPGFMVFAVSCTPAIPSFSLFCFCVAVETAD